MPTATTMIALAIPTVVAGGLAAALLWPQGPSLEDAFHAACVEVLSDRLRAPSTLNVLGWHGFMQRPAEQDEAIDPPSTASDVGEEIVDATNQNRDFLIRAYNSRPESYVLFQDLVRYEADNGFGVPIANEALCSVVLVGEVSPDKIEVSSVKINGTTQLDWRIEMLRTLR